MVVTARVPTVETGVTHERTATPSMWTVQAPHNPDPQPNFAPLRSRTSRSTHSRGVASSTSTVLVVPFTVKVMLMGLLQGGLCRVRAGEGAYTRPAPGLSAGIGLGTSNGNG